MTALRMPKPWHDDVLRLFDLGGHDAMRVVGGAVRNALLGLPIDDCDIDFATTHTPDAITSILTKAGIAVKPTGIDHGTVTAILNARPYEITTLRQDVATDGRRAVVAYTTDWAVDASRRDFTINALYADAAGVISDPTGQGVHDIHARTLCFIGEPQARIREDYLRIIRLFRFHACLPDMVCDPVAVAACDDLADGLAHLSHERITSEVGRLLGGVNTAATLALLNGGAVGAWLGIQPEAATWFARLEQMRPITGAVAEVAPYVLAFGAHWPDYLLLPRRVLKQRDVLMTLINNPMSWQEAQYRHGADIAQAVVVIRAVYDGARLSNEEWKGIKSYTPPVSPIHAVDVQAEGFFGPELGRELKKREENWIKATFPQ